MKKLYFTLIGMVAFCANAQVVEIPDANFKARLIQLGYDDNDDGEIQNTEAEGITSLILAYPYNIHSIEGAQNFTNITFLSCHQQPIDGAIDISGLEFLDTFSVGSDGVTSLNASMCPALEELLLSSNPSITSIDVSGCSSLTSITCPSSGNLSEFLFEGCTSLQGIYCIGSQITTLDVSGLPNLKELTWANSQLTSLNAGGCEFLELVMVPNNDLTSLNVEGCVMLENLNINGSALTELQLSGLSSLYFLSFDENPLITVDISGCSTLEGFGLPDGNVTSLNVQGCTAMTNLSVGSNLLTSLDVSGLSNLWEVAVVNNNITQLNLDGCTGLGNLVCINNPVTSLDLSTVTNLWQFNCSNTPIETINLSNHPNLDNFYCQDCTALESLYIKNGTDEIIDIYNTPSLVYVCADETEIYPLNEYFLGLGQEVNVNSYCSFVPGGNFNTVTGTLSFDINGNGCDDEDDKLSNVLIMIEGSMQTGITYTDSDGNFTYYLGLEEVNIHPVFEAPEFFNFAPASVDQIFDTTGNEMTADFCLTPNGMHPDLDISLLPIFDARPGFDATYQLIVTNKGNQVQSGSISLTYNDVVIDYIQSSQIPVTNISGSLTWDFTDLAPFNNTIIDLTFNVNSPLEEPSVNIDDVLSFSTAITTSETDDTPEDNIYQFDQLVIGSYDPNDKQVAQGENITPEQAGDYLHYLIRFQNTGTAEAINVVVKDMLADNLDWETFQPVSASHVYRATLTEGNKAEFFFENIWLPAEEDNEPGSHGFIAFKIKPQAGAVVGDEFENTAEIYFDFNAPIITNTVTTVIEVLGTSNFEFGQYFMLYPNPAKDFVHISLKQNISIKSVTIYNMLGQPVMNINPGSTVDSITMNTVGLPSGQYFITIETDKGKTVSKLIKQ